jgi:hypothetical protein
MTEWSEEALRNIVKSDDLHITPFRQECITYDTPTWIWSVAVGDALYVRGYNGTKSRRYQSAVRHKAGRIIAAGMRLASSGFKAKSTTASMPPIAPSTARALISAP